MTEETGKGNTMPDEKETIIGRPRRAGEIIGRLVIGADMMPEADRPLDREWLRDRLIQANLAGGPATVHRNVQHCLGWLLVNGIRTRQGFEQFLAHDGVQDELRDAYRTVLRRRSVGRDFEAGADYVDPVGLCQWGGLLYQAAGGGRDGLLAATAALRGLLADYPEALDGLKRAHGVDRDGRNVVDQAAAAMIDDLGQDLVGQLVAAVSRPKRRRRKSAPKLPAGLKLTRRTKLAAKR